MCLKLKHPYSLIIKNVNYKLNITLKVTITSESLVPFSGFMLQARLVKTNHIVGTWNYNATLYPYIGAMKCLDKNVSFSCRDITV